MLGTVKEKWMKIYLSEKLDIRDPVNLLVCSKLEVRGRQMELLSMIVRKMKVVFLKSLSVFSKL